MSINQHSSFTNKIVENEHMSLPVEKIQSVSPCTPVFSVLQSFMPGGEKIIAVKSDYNEVLGFIDILDLYRTSMGSYLYFMESASDVEKISGFLSEFFQNGRKLLVSEVMCSNRALFITDYEKPLRVLFLMARYNRQSLPVTDEKGRLRGAVSASSLLNLVAGNEKWMAAIDTET